MALALGIESCLIIMNSAMEYVDYFEAALFASVFHLNADDFTGFPIKSE